MQCRDRKEQEEAIKVCDQSFPPQIRIYEKENCAEIIDKIDKYAVFFVSYEKGEVAGYAAMYNNDIDTRIAYITMIGVRDRYQRRHIGSELMFYCVKAARKKQMKAIRLEVLNTNKKAIDFYENLGFVFERKSSNECRYMLLILAEDDSLK